MDVPKFPKRSLSSYSKRHLSRLNKLSTEEELRNIKGHNSSKLFVLQGSYVEGMRKVKLVEELSDIDSASDDEKKWIHKKNKRKVSSDSDLEDSGSPIHNFPNIRKKKKESCVTSVPFTDGTQSFSTNKSYYSIQNPPYKMEENSLAISSASQISAAGSLGVVQAVDYFNTRTTAEMQAETNTKILERILEKVNYLVTKVKVLEEKIDSQRSNAAEESEVMSETLEMFPIQDEMALFDLESFILDKVNRTLLVTALSGIGGSKPDNVVTNILKRTISDKVAEEFSYAGAKKKKEFRKLEFAKVVLDATRRNFPSVTEEEVSSRIANWLRHAKSRRERNEKINYADCM